jgi:hypothetical protein
MRALIKGGLLVWQTEDLEEEDMDVRGGGQAAEDRRIVKDGYESDEDETKPQINKEMVAGEVPSTAPSLVRPSSWTICRTSSSWSLTLTRS